MRETFWFGPTPSDETCTQVGDPDYVIKGYAECKAYVGQLYRFLAEKDYTRDKIPNEFKLYVKREAHDLGFYYEVVSRFPSDLEVGYDISILIDNEGPSVWDVVAKQELGLA
jgi:hypothetical protein